MSVVGDGDLFAVKFCQKLYGQDVCMVWTITTENPSGPFDLNEFLEKLRDYIGPIINGAQVGSISNNNIAIENLTDGVSFSEVAWTGAGLVVGVGMPSFVAAGIRLNRGNKTTRNGYKRVPGMAEDIITGGVFDGSFITTSLTPLATAFSTATVLTASGGETVQVAPVIIGRNAAGFDLTRVQPVVSATINPNATTQNSRKVGSGS